MTAARSSSARWLYLLGIAALLVAGGVLGLLIGGKRASARHEMAARAEAEARGPRVVVTTARRSPSQRVVVVQGEARPFFSVTLYAKISGYLQKVSVDKGDRVRQGQVLAVIESPEIDKQYQAAVADAKNKRAIARRLTALSPAVASEQEAEQARTNAAMAEATVESLAMQRSYEVLRAPFAGTVTARFADPGALIQGATGAQTGALPVVAVAQTERLRVYVYLDQADAPFVRVGDPVEIRIAERPGLKLAGAVARLSGELDPRTRMMLDEVDLDNRDGLIVPGSFVEATLRSRAPSYVEIPAEALVLHGDRPLVAVVGPDDQVHFRPVAVGDNDGQTVRLASGLSGGERIALNLGESVADGARVQPIVQPSGPPAGPPAGQQQGGGGQSTGRDGGQER